MLFNRIIGQVAYIRALPLERQRFLAQIDKLLDAMRVSENMSIDDESALEVLSADVAGRSGMPHFTKIWKGLGSK